MDGFSSPASLCAAVAGLGAAGSAFYCHQQVGALRKQIDMSKTDVITVLTTEISKLLKRVEVLEKKLAVRTTEPATPRVIKKKTLKPIPPPPPPVVIEEDVDIEMSDSGSNLSVSEDDFDTSDIEALALKISSGR
jgi:hypothetical protein